MKLIKEKKRYFRPLLRNATRRGPSPVWRLVVLDNLSFNYDVDYFLSFFLSWSWLLPRHLHFITLDSIVPYLDFISLIGLVVKSSKTKQLRMLSYSDSWSC